MMQGKLIVIEGIDGSGKSTQYKKLCQRLENENVDFRKIVFPRYEKDSSALIREYLSGGFGTKPNDVNAYAASTFFAVDRFASFKTDWGEYYNNGGLILSDRYTTSNACHQGSKLPRKDRLEFLNWLYDFEFRLLGLPAPSLVIYLNIEIDVSRQQMDTRQSETNTEADIHEKDFEYLSDSLDAGRFAAQVYGWKVIDCVVDGKMRSIDDIHEEIYNTVISSINN